MPFFQSTFGDTAQLTSVSVCLPVLEWLLRDTRLGPILLPFCVKNIGPQP
jgi:hypothetical protein